MTIANRWGEPTGPDTVERGDLVQHVRGTTRGFVIGVRDGGPLPLEDALVHIVLDGGGRGEQSQVYGWLEQFPRKDLRVVKKGVR